MNTTTYGGDCRTSYFNISSNGFWENLKSSDVVFGYSLPLLESQILLIFIFIFMTHLVLRSIGVSLIASHMIAGLILGSQMFDVYEKSSGKLSLDPALDGNAALKSVSTFGSLMFIVLMTVRTSRRMVFNSGKLPILIGILSFFLPMLPLCFRNLSSDNLNPHYMPLKKALFERTIIVISQSTILLPATTYILLELKILNSEIGRLALSASVINDIFGLFFFALGGLGDTYKNVSPVRAYHDFIAVVIFILIVFLVFKPIVDWIIDRTPEGKPVEDKYVHAMVITVLASSVFSVVCNLKHVLGPLVIGLVIPEGPPLGSALEAKYEKLTMNVFLPISIAVSTMRCDGLRMFTEFNDILYNMFFMGLTVVLKLIACMVPCLYYKLPFNESMAVSIILSYKSFPDFVIYEPILDETYISKGTYAFLVIYALLNAGIVPTVLRGLYDPKQKYVNYEKRNIFHLKPNSDLRILTCIHKPENVSETIALLQLLSSPNQDFPIDVTVLHLVKLVGQINPILISLNKKSKNLHSKYSYIHTANLAFRQFMLQSINSVNVTMFTAFSHENIMHEDICTLALDNTSSMIIVPSGRRWTINGMFESDDEAIRQLNRSLIGGAPCSIGILIERGNISRRIRKEYYSIDVGMIFFGGKDDREALSLVKRMKHNRRVHVTVTRIVFTQEIESQDWEYILDHESLMDLKINEDTNYNNVCYIEKNVTCGAELVNIVRLMAGEYDLLVAGRDQGIASLKFSGLNEWVELPELGIIGDLLAAKDLSSQVSVLVVQQQQHV